MFCKIFNQIFDSSIVERPDTRFTFIDLLILADQNGVVDMTHEAIARRTNRPVEIIRETIKELESPDPRSRTPDANGARIFRLDDHRDWGWGIVNYERFRKLSSEEQRREKTNARVKKYRDLHKCNAPVTLVNDSPSASASSLKEEGEYEGEINMGPYTSAWNALPKEYPKITLPLSSVRRKHLQSRLKEKFFTEHFLMTMTKLRDSDFCKGKSDRGWKATFDWLILNDNNIHKIMEGKYDNKVNKRIKEV